MNLSTFDAVPVTDHAADGPHEELAFHSFDPLVQPFLAVPGEDGYRGLRQDGAVVDLVVDEMDGNAGYLHAVGERLSHGVRAAERRQQRGMGVDDTVRKPLDELGAHDLHETGEDHQMGLVFRDGFGQRAVPRRPIRKSPQPYHEGGEAGASRPIKPFDAGAIRANGDDSGSVSWIGTSVDQCL